MFYSIPSVFIPWALLVQCLSAQSSSVISVSPLPSNLLSRSAASFSGSIPATVISGARNVTNTPWSSISSATEDLTAIAGLPTSSVQGNGTASATKSPHPRPSNNRPCNGYPEFCQRKFSNISMVVAHNSPFVKAHNAASNQLYPVLNQLNDGIRGCKSIGVDYKVFKLMWCCSTVRNTEAQCFF
jgi:hypothetical protein